jgi:cellulose biosynthesis protein BcsQ
VKVYASYNIKGGVGKTTAAVNLAFLASTAGQRTLVWDLDPQGAASYFFRVKPKWKGGAKALIRGKRSPEPLIRGTDFERLDLLRAHFGYRHMDVVLSKLKSPDHRLARVLALLEGEYDRVFLDCPAGITLAADSVFRACDVLLVPTIPTTLSLRTLIQLLKHLKRERVRGLSVTPFFSMVDLRKALQQRICRRPPDGFLQSHIPYLSAIERMAERRAPLPSYAPASRAAEAFEALWREAEASHAPGVSPDRRQLQAVLG